MTLCLSPLRRALTPGEGLCESLSDPKPISLPQPALFSSRFSFDRPSAEPFSAVIDRIPVEVFVEVFQHLDLKSAFALASSNKRFATIMKTHRCAIILRIVKEEFCPFDGLLQVVKASPEDLCFPWGTWLDKRVCRKNTVLCGISDSGGKGRELLRAMTYKDQNKTFPLHTSSMGITSGFSL